MAAWKALQRNGYQRVPNIFEASPQCRGTSTAMPRATELQWFTPAEPQAPTCFRSFGCLAIATT